MISPCPPYYSSALSCLLRSHHVLLFRLVASDCLSCTAKLGRSVLSSSLALSPCRSHPVFIFCLAILLAFCLLFSAMRQLLSDIEKLGCSCHTRAPKPPSVAAVTPGHPNQSLCPVCVGVQRRERAVSRSERALVSGQLDREIYLVGPRFWVGRLSRNSSKLVDSLEVEEGTRCSRRVAPLRRRGNSEVDRIPCLLCLNEDRLRAIRNYSTGAFVHGIAGSALEKDNVVKHSKSDIQEKAVSLERQPTRTINEILRSTPIGRAVASASSEERIASVACLRWRTWSQGRRCPSPSFPRSWSLTRGTASASDKQITRSTSVKNSRALLERRWATISFRLWGIAGTCPCWWTGRRAVASGRRSLFWHLRRTNFINNAQRWQKYQRWK